MKGWLIILVGVLLLVGCKSEEERYDWAVKFCGKTENVLVYKAYNNSRDFVVCKDNRFTDVPN